MRSTTVQFGPWLPDDDKNIVPGSQGEQLNAQEVPLAEAKNVEFTASAWRLYQPFAATSGTLAGVPVDAITVDYNGAILTFAAYNGKLYKIDGATVTDVSKSGGYNTTAAWDFQRFGDCLIATNGVDAPQDFDLGTSTAFADLAGTPPHATVVGVVRDFVVFGDTSSYSYPDGSTGSTYRVHWSAIANPTSWPVPLTQAARAAQSGSQDNYADYGDVMAVTEGEEFGLIFQQRAIVRMRYIGGDPVFEFYTFERKRGLLAKRAYAQIGNLIFFLSGDGFCMTDGNQVTPIGYGKVNRWFFANCADTSKVRAAIDTNKQCVYWSFPSTASGANDRQIIYNFAEGRWSYAVDTTYAMFQGLTAGQHIPQAFDASGNLGTLSGSQSDGEIETKQFRLVPNMRSLVSRARPMTDAQCTLAIAATLSDDDTQTFSSYASRQSRSRTIPLRANGYIHALNMKLGSAASYAQGVSLDFTPRSSR